ncbi:MAG: aspartate dehydrogenase domain-containing protein [Burkholderiaceae bacterium]
MNVAAALVWPVSGPTGTEVQIWADPGIDRNIHQIEVDADSARLSMRTRTCPARRIRQRPDAPSRRSPARLVATFRVGS